MNLLDLPLDIGLLIVSYLDLGTKIELYEKCQELRAWFAGFHIKRLILTKNRYASVTSLNKSLVNDFSSHVKVLNLAAVPNLSVYLLTKHLNNFDNLDTLDITLTDFFLEDLPDICPRSVKHIGVNFFKYPTEHIQRAIWSRCVEFFQEMCFKSIHFVLCDLCSSDLPMIFLKKVPKTDNLKVTVADNFKELSEGVDLGLIRPLETIEINFTELTFNIRDSRVTHKSSKTLRGIAELNFSGVEYIFFMYLEIINIYVSPKLASIFSKACIDLNIEVCSKLPLNFLLDGNILFKAWNKYDFVFDQHFIDNLVLELKNYFPTYACFHGKSMKKMEITPSHNDWVCIDTCRGFEKEFKRLPCNVTFTDFCRHKGTVKRSYHPITLSRKAELFENVRYLRLSNVSIKEDFFGKLFVFCEKLETLDIYEERLHRPVVNGGYLLNLSKSIHTTTSVKNIKLTSVNIDYKLAFETFSRCTSLENVHLCEYERFINENEIPVAEVMKMIENCKNLYSVFIEADLHAVTMELFMSALKAIMRNTKNRLLSVEICECYRGWNPFGDVFNPSPLHILD